MSKSKYKQGELLIKQHYMEKIALLIDLIVSDLGVSREQVAAKLGVTSRTVENYLKELDK